MNAYNPPVRLIPETEDERTERLAEEAGPIGHDAPRGSMAHDNYRAACVAAGEVRGRAIYSEAHRQSLAAWNRGERASPWPDPTPEDNARADNAVWGLAVGMIDAARARRAS